MLEQKLPNAFRIQSSARHGKMQMKDRLEFFRIQYKVYFTSFDLQQEIYISNLEM